jgi:hypothetical protein
MSIKYLDLLVAFQQSCKGLIQIKPFLSEKTLVQNCTDILIGKKYFVRQMTFRTFYLFYLLTILLLVFGFLTKDVQIIATSWQTTIIKGTWTFFIPTAIGGLLTGFIYHYWFNSGRPVHKWTVILHFSLVTLGLLFSLNIYKLATVILCLGVPDTCSLAFGDNSLLFILLGPLLLIASLIIFIIGLAKAKQTPT